MQWRSRHLSIPERETSWHMNSLVTASKSSSTWSEGAAQAHDHDHLLRGQLGLQTSRRVRSVVEDLSLLLFVDRFFKDAKALGQHGCGLRVGSDFSTHSSRSAGIFVHVNPYDFSLPVDCSGSIYSLRPARTMNNR